GSAKCTDLMLGNVAGDRVVDCGACGNICSTNGVTSLSCTSGRCASTCAARYADCNGNADPSRDDGCELFRDSLDKCGNDCNGAGVACGPTLVCNSGGCVAPSGVAVLSVPFTDATHFQRFANLFPSPAKLEGATLTLRIYAPGATSGTLVMFLSDSQSNFSPDVLQTELSSLSAKWMDLTIPVVSAGSFDATMLKQINFDLKAGPGPWANPTIVYVDGIRASNLVLNETFDSSPGMLVKSSIVAVSGSTVTWLQSLP
ncbi:MAG TPA: hypothetical protein VJV79_26320, partial [Polyangiaceae bacterium]|nr:hypothetical protein [Polyangiaceae bacterium]